LTPTSWKKYCFEEFRVFYRLILAHLLADFVLQTRWMVTRKRTVSGLAIHIGIVGLSMVLVMWDQLVAWWPWLLVILAVHAATDWTKLRLEPHLHLPPIVPFLLDQVVHVLTIALVVAVANPNGLSLVPSESDSLWWIASVYLIATFALSIALTLWLDPSSLMQRPPVARLTIIVAAALALTLAWRGWPILIPVVGLVLYEIVARRLGRKQVTKTFPIEFWSAVVVATSLGWVLV
jgi:hypothetical protein